MGRSYYIVGLVFPVFFPISLLIASQPIHRIKVHLYDRKVPTDAVVKIALKSTPFLILGLQ